jgi:hypothetical protein
MTRNLCSEPSCGYRRLYEGAQSSLSDMAARHSEALGRNGRLRQAIILTLKQTFPQAFAKAEQGLGKRFHSVDDEVLIAYLQGFLSSAPEQHTAPGVGVEELRAALATAGLAVPPGDDLAAWARAIAAGAHHHHQAPTEPAPAVDRSPVAPTPAASSKPTPAGEDLFQDLFAAEPSPATTTPPAVPARGAEDPFESLWDADSAPDTGPRVPVSDDPFNAPARTSEAPDAPLGATDDPFAALVAADGVTAGSETTAVEDDPFTGLWEPDPADTPAPAGGPQTTGSPDSDAVDIDELFAGDGTTTAARSQPAADVEDDASASTTDAPPAVALEDLFSPVEEVTFEDLFAQAGDEPPGADNTGHPDHTERAPVRRNGVTTNHDGPLRPQLLISPPSKLAGRTVRRGRTEQDLPGSPVHSVDQGVQDRLLAAVQVSRPVFTSDLVSLVGAEQVADWEATCRSDTHAPVRFIPPKGRHKLRGSLVLPVALSDAPTPEFKASVWAAVMDAYRGAKLYEVAVLLHRLSEMVIAHQVSEHTLTLRLAEPRGMTGVVVCFVPELPSGSPARAELAERVEKLLGERLTLVAALTTQVAALERVTDALATEATARGWQPLMPVVAATSWEYADSRGSTFKAVLGT